MGLAELMHSNGWQRLWVAFSVLYLLLVVSIIGSSFPKASDYTRIRLQASMEAVDNYTKKLKDKTKGTEGWRLLPCCNFPLNEYGSYPSDEEKIKLLHEGYKDRVDFSKIEAEYNRNINNLPITQAKAVAWAFLAWIVPCLMVYGLGLVVAWIVRGFQRGKS